MAGPAWRGVAEECRGLYWEVHEALPSGATSSEPGPLVSGLELGRLQPRESCAIAVTPGLDVLFDLRMRGQPGRPRLVPVYLLPNLVKARLAQHRVTQLGPGVVVPDGVLHQEQGGPQLPA